MIDITPVPNRSTRPDTIDDDADSFFGKLPQYGADLIALQANLNAIAYGGAYALPYVFNGPAGQGGKLTFSGGTSLDTATFITLDNVTSGGRTVTPQVASFGLSTNYVKGTLRIEKLGDPSKYLIFNVTALSVNAGYQSVYVSKVDSSAATPFSLMDNLMVQFTRAGDQGAPASLTGVLWVRDEKASGTAGGSSVQGANTRVLNTIKKNTIVNSSVSGNQVTLPAGTYRFWAAAPVFGAGDNQAYLYNVTAGGVQVLGGSTGSASAPGLSMIAECEFTITVASVFEIRHYCSTATAATGLGRPSGSGQVEVYAQAFFERVA